jgi:hypothetical protein
MHVAQGSSPATDRSTAITNLLEEPMRRALIVFIVLVSAVDLGALRRQTSPPVSRAVFVAYYWRARPGQIDAYSEYIKTVAEPIDEDARRADVFEEVRTVTPAPGTVTDWTHLRIFRLKDAAHAEMLGAGLDAATIRVVPDEAQRKANSERSAGLRDLVRREVWTELR